LQNQIPPFWDSAHKLLKLEISSIFVKILKWGDKVTPVNGPAQHGRHKRLEAMKGAASHPAPAQLAEIK
jgi:hypothetical protein